MLQKKVSGCFSVGPVRKPKILPVEDNAWCLFIGRYFHRIGSTTLDFVKKKKILRLMRKVYLICSIPHNMHVENGKGVLHLQFALQYASEELF